MDFSTIVVIVLVAGVVYMAYKAFVKRADTNQDGVVSAEEAKVEVAKEVEEVKVVAKKATAAAKTGATKAKATVKKATTRKPKAK